MRIDISSSTISLAPGSLLSLQDAAGTRVLCRSGLLWITQEGDVKDSIVRPGEVLTIRNSGRTVLSALDAAALSIFGPGVANVSVQRQKVREPRMMADCRPCS